MSLLMTKREIVLINTKQAKLIIRAHTKIHYPKGAKVPLVIDKTNPSPISVQVIGAVETTLRAITESIAKDAGFKNLADFKSHWKNKVYGPKGIDPSGGSRHADDCKVVLYRYRRTELVQKRLKVS